MKVNEILEKMSKGISYTDDLVKRNYIPFTEKVEIIDDLIDAVTYKNDGIFMYDINEVEMNKVLTFLEAYTNLDLDNGVGDYDLIVQNELLEHIYFSIGSDVKRLNSMFEDRFYDYIKQNNSLESVVNNKLGMVVDALIGVANNFSNKINETDTNTLKDAILQGMNEISGTLLGS